MARAVINCIMSAPNFAREFCQYVLSICEPAVLKWFHLDTYVGSSIVLKSEARDTRVADEPAALFFKTAAIEVTNTHCSPAEFSHQFRQASVRTCSAAALWHFQDVHQRLGADALQAVEPCRTAHAFQAQPPRVYGLRGFGLSGLHFR
jgi:hypothetical protein